MIDLTLSFDNGPDEGVTPFVLDTLARRGIRATFFVLGHKLAKPSGLRLATRAHAEGHWIGNHTYSHTTPFGLRDDRDGAEEEIGRTQRLIGGLAHPRKLFRPFGGGGYLDRRLFNPAVVDYLKREQFTCVLWNSIPRDWVDPDGWVETALTQVRAQPATLMVLHDLPTGAMAHLDRFLDAALALGTRFLQEFPSDCVPIMKGAVVRPLEPYVAERAVAT
jgi:peptidoglycan/xylan/chitin deacetylase (PgdA/CDA1 family)